MMTGTVQIHHRFGEVSTHVFGKELAKDMQVYSTIECNVVSYTM
jgi:hypothetical protein